MYAVVCVVRGILPETVQIGPDAEVLRDATDIEDVDCGEDEVGIYDLNTGKKCDEVVDLLWYSDEECQEEGVVWASLVRPSLV